MCGITGIFGPRSHDRDLLARMADRLVHRGPDDAGVWTDPDHPVGLAHRRLAIVDLSAAGHQPMLSDDGRWVVSYNGEIYNHHDIRAELDAQLAINWRGHSDTETLIEAVACWGIERTIEKLVGMFAIALVDRRESKLHLIRDRFGEKPLYYGRGGRDLLFASELKAFREHPDFSPTLDMDALSGYVARGYVAAPRSIFAGIRKLPPGHWISIDLRSGSAELPTPRPYWSYAKVVEEGLRQPFADRTEAVDAIDAALHRSIRQQAVADVPVGTFLSGGIDSSLITAIYHAGHPRRVKSFTIGFDEAGYDESADARRVAKHLGTDHHELRVSSADAMALIPDLPRVYDEPFADSSQIPTMLVSHMARTSVTVALSGDAGDELFGGYNRYTRLPALWNAMKAVSVVRTFGTTRGVDQRSVGLVSD